MRVEASGLRLRNPRVLPLEKNQLIDEEKSGAIYVALDKRDDPERESVLSTLNSITKSACPLIEECGLLTQRGP
jgi:hypothetical protein